MAITIEFRKQRYKNIVYVDFNGNTYKFSRFLQLPEAKKIIAKIYHKIQTEYPYEDNGDMHDTVGKFINRHFMDYDKTYDIVILGDKDNEKVIFNTED